MNDVLHTPRHIMKSLSWDAAMEACKDKHYRMTEDAQNDQFIVEYTHEDSGIVTMAADRSPLGAVHKLDDTLATMKGQQDG